MWDMDGKHYYDMTSNGIGSCLLGHADPDVTEAVVNRIQNGSMSTLNVPEEVQLAERLCEIHPWAEQVRFAKIAGTVGYASETAFYQAFRNHFHVTPQQYRKRSAVR